MADISTFLERVPAEYHPVQPRELDGRVYAAEGGDSADGAADGTGTGPGDGVEAGGDPGDASPGDAAAGGATTEPQAVARVLLADAPELELLTPVVSRAYREAIEQHVRSGTRIDVVATGDARQALLSGPLAAVQPLLATKPGVTLAVHDGDVPFAVLLRPGRVAFAMADGAGEIELLYVSDGAAAREWARNVFDVYRAEADPLQ